MMSPAKKDKLDVSIDQQWLNLFNSTIHHQTLASEPDPVLPCQIK